MKILTLFTRFLLFKPTLFIIRVDISFFLLSKFLPMNLRLWKYMSSAKHRTKHNLAIE